MEEFHLDLITKNFKSEEEFILKHQEKGDAFINFCDTKTKEELSKTILFQYKNKHITALQLLELIQQHDFLYIHFVLFNNIKRDYKQILNK